MKTERNILIAFILNFSFSIFEFFGGIFTGSVAIISDAVHDAADSLSIGISYFLERKSKKKADEKNTYGYARYSAVGGFITIIILIFSSVMVIYNAIRRITAPVEINYDGMIIFSVVGVCVNFFAAFFTREGDSLNQKAVNLHMLEDLWGWITVLIGAVVMRFSNFSILDPIISIVVSGYILVNALKKFKEILDLFLEKVPKNIDVSEIEKCIEEIEGVQGVHDIHVWSLDGRYNYATMHIVSNSKTHEIKEKIRKELHSRGIDHVTLETEKTDEPCNEKECHAEHHYHSNHLHKHS